MNEDSKSKNSERKEMPDWLNLIIGISIFFFFIAALVKCGDNYEKQNIKNKKESECGLINADINKKPTPKLSEEVMEIYRKQNQRENEYRFNKDNPWMKEQMDPRH